jgi:hypothetical protein
MRGAHLLFCAKDYRDSGRDVMLVNVSARAQHIIEVAVGHAC